MRKAWHNGFCRDIAPAVKYAHEMCGLENLQTKKYEEVLVMRVTNKRSGKGGTILLDLEDEEFVKSYFWFLHPRGVMTSVGGKCFFLLARVLVSAKHNECVLFRNGDCNDCRKSNLVKVSRKEIAARTPHHPTLKGGIRMLNYKDRHGKPRQKIIADICVNGQRKTRTFEVARYGEMEAKLMAAGWRLEQMPDDLRQRLEEDMRTDIEETPRGLDECGRPVAVTDFDFDAVDSSSSPNVSHHRCLAVAGFLLWSEATAGSMTLVGIQWISLLGFILFGIILVAILLCKSCHLFGRPIEKPILCGDPIQKGKADPNDIYIFQKESPESVLGKSLDARITRLKETQELKRKHDLERKNLYSQIRASRNDSGVGVGQSHCSRLFSHGCLHTYSVTEMFEDWLLSGGEEIIRKQKERFGDKLAWEYAFFWGYQIAKNPNYLPSLFGCMATEQSSTNNQELRDKSSDGSQEVKA